ncbi:hypothetical protein DV515_00018730 [Chloebia gouldiae]|uniref:REST corepressor helical domain-containing protein n=1 Tax=Chloebia gouldiae TaxID=44316 RepID=A0A3L8Q6P9_CHLGU|nr:hypothetical protein DV515_00018730 [Chloebia gouldiae]
MDRQARRLLGRRDRDDSNDETEEHRPNPEGDVEPADPKKEVGGHGGRPCYAKAGPRKEPQYRHHPPARQRRRPPRGMRLSREDVAEVTANPDLGARALRQLDCQLVALKRQVRPEGPPRGHARDPSEPPPRSPQVQRIKQINSGLRQALDGGLEGLRPPEGNSKFSSRWTTDEQLLVVQGEWPPSLGSSPSSLASLVPLSAVSLSPALRRYGRDFPAVAAVLGNKTAAQVRSFVLGPRRRLGLERLLQERRGQGEPPGDRPEPEEEEEVRKGGGGAALVTGPSPGRGAWTGRSADPGLGPDAHRRQSQTPVNH